MNGIRPPAVSGLFYPADATELARTVTAFLHAGRTTTPPDISPGSSDSPDSPKAIIAPHAGYDYSGPVAGSAYAALNAMRDIVGRVIIIGPTHRVAFPGLAVSSAEEWATPLGRVQVDQQAVEQILTFPQVIELDEAHANEHSLEVHLPFLQTVFDRFMIVPIVCGQVTTDEVVEVLDSLWGGDETIFVISSDLSHYHDYDVARQMDRITSDLILEMRPDAIAEKQACGCQPIRAMLMLAERHGLHAELIDLRNSGDTAGTRDRVVGYGAFTFA